MNYISSTTDLFSQLPIENTDNLLPTELANLINDAFLIPMKEFSAINEIDIVILTHHQLHMTLHSQT